MSQEIQPFGAPIERTIYDVPIEGIVNNMAYYSGRFAGKAIAERIFRDYDSLTKVYNRQGFVEAIDWMLMSNPDKTFALAAVDVGNHKNTNTEYGHNGGDHVLQMSAHRLRRKDDIVGRLGGDEFATLFELDRRPDGRSHEEQIADQIAYIKDVRNPIVEMYPKLDSGPVRVFMGVGAVVYDRSMTFEQNYNLADMECEDDKLSVREIYGEMRVTV